MTDLVSTNLNALAYQKIWDLERVRLDYGNPELYVCRWSGALVSGLWLRRNRRTVGEIHQLPQHFFCYGTGYIHHPDCRPSIAWALGAAWD